jgi:hypothetical protein
LSRIRFSTAALGWRTVSLKRKRSSCASQERPRQRARDAVGGDARLLHRLEQRRLRLRGRAVDLVGEQQLREHRAGEELERVLLLVEHVAAAHVARHQVGRELDALELAAEHAAERAHQQRLAEAGRPFEEHVAAGEHRQQRVLDDLLLPDERAAHLVADPREPLTQFFDSHL